MNTDKNLHAHISREQADCDGRTGDDYVMTYNDDETAEREAAKGVNDFSDIHFMKRVMMSQCSPFAVAKMTIHVSETGVTWNEATEEGYRAGEIIWCSDDCDEARTGHFDAFAEAMGY